MAFKHREMEDDRQKFVFFWKANEKNGYLSQWYMSTFVVDGVTYNCCEQYMMAGKARLFGDGRIEKSILAKTDPHQHKALGQRVKPFEQSVWDDNCREIVYQGSGSGSGSGSGNLAKFRQNDNLRRNLLATGSKILVEASPMDKIWGIGLDASNPDATKPDRWKGSNFLGEVLMRVRDTLRKEEEDQKN